MLPLRHAILPLPSCLFALLACLPHVAAKPPPKGGLPKGIPGGLGGGPPWRAAIDKVFNEACTMNKGAPSVFCFPDKKALLEAMEVEQYGIDMTGEMYLMDVHVVVNQLLGWPPAWSMVQDVLDPAKPWTGPFCEKVIGGPWWQVLPLIRKSFLSPRQTLVQLEKQTPHVAAGMQRWFEAIRVSGNSQTQKLLKEFKANDAADVKAKTVHARPMMRLMQQVHSKMVQHVFGTACKDSPAARKKLMANDTNGLTVLHHVASLGDTAGAKAILKAVPKAQRADFVATRDLQGYRAEDWARLGDFGDTLEAIQSLSGRKRAKGEKEEAAETIGPADAVKQFAPLAMAEEEAPTCSIASGLDGTSPACGDGGWRSWDGKGVPSEWLPKSDEPPCFADTIHVSQFDFEVFMQHYVLHPRPLLIRGGAQLSPELAQNYTREGLIEVAGDRKVDAARFPSAREFDGSMPQVKPLREYIEDFEGRSSENAAKRLHYVYQRLPQEEVFLNFSAALPSVIAGQVDHIGTNFYLGSTLMGVPPHHVSPVVDTLVFGRKLWFLEPPGRELVVHETQYDYLVRMDGAPTARKCLQEAGDLLYVPRAWTQSNLCLGDCVGALHEVTHNRWDLRD